MRTKYSWKELKDIAIDVIGYLEVLLDEEEAEVVSIENLKQGGKEEEIADAIIEYWEEDTSNL